MRLKLLSILFFTLLGGKLFAQNTQDRLISVNFNQASVAEMVSDLEKKTSFHFYYDPKVMDSLKINLKVDEKPISFILEQAFKGTDYNFAINENNIFLNRIRKINT